MATATLTRTDVYQKVTDAIVAQLEKGVRPWVKPWASGGTPSRPLRSNGKPYSGVNVIMLWITAEMKGYASPYWFTFNQAKDLGAFVKRGEHGTKVVYANAFTKHETDDDGNSVEKRIPFLKEYTVFNADQIEGLPEKFQAAAKPAETAKERIERADAFFANTGAEIRHSGNGAFYSPAHDYINLPKFESFTTPEAYVGTAAHELTHWTGHKSRLDRLESFGKKSWGDEGYAMEELVAELGASYLAADLATEIEPRDDHAQYLDHWLKVLKSDKRAIFTAASHASKAVDYLYGLQPGGADEPEDEE